MSQRIITRGRSVVAASVVPPPAAQVSTAPVSSASVSVGGTSDHGDEPQRHPWSEAGRAGAGPSQSQSLLSRHCSEAPVDSTRRMRRHTVFLSLIAFAALALSLAEGVYDASPLSLAGFGAGGVATFCAAGYVAATQRAEEWLVLLSLCGCFVAAVLDDVHRGEALRNRAFPLLALPVIALACTAKLPRAASGGFLFGVIAWTVASDLESSFRYGLWDGAGHGREQALRRCASLCDCAEPPCGLPPLEALSNSFAKLCAVGVVHVLLRTTGDALQGERGMVAVYADAAQSIAVHLAAFDLDNAERRLKKDEALLPPDLSQALRAILENMHTYRQYLPASCLPVVEEDTSEDCADIVSQATGNVSLICTQPSVSLNVGMGVTVSIPTSARSPPQASRSSLVGCKRASELHLGTVGDREQYTRKQTTDSAQPFDSVAGGSANNTSSVGGHTGDHVSEHSSAYMRKSSSPHRPSVHDLKAAPSFINSRPTGLRFNRCTLVVANMHDTTYILDEGIPAGQQDSPDFLHAYELYVSAAVGRYHAAKGVVDVLVGDHIFATFNASRPCAQHAISAVSASTKFLRSIPHIRANVGIATGKCSHGDIGCADMRRYITIGSTCMKALAIERVARLWNVDILCNSATYLDTFHAFELRIVVQRLIFRKGLEVRPDDSGRERTSPSSSRRAGAPSPFGSLKSTSGSHTVLTTDLQDTMAENSPDKATYQLLYEALVKIKRRDKASFQSAPVEGPGGLASSSQYTDSTVLSHGDPEEWMYELENKQEWERYNESGEMYLKGRPRTAVLAHIKGAPPEIASRFESAMNQDCCVQIYHM
eukprot:Rhum_TRINITY_DN11799_c0_g1::Rhum_TRINITY_DN11799_c0_g1_i1::g.46305::m.46305